MGRSSVQLFSQLQSSLPHKMLPKSPSLALSVPTLRCRCFALCHAMQDPSHSCEFHGAIKCAAVLAVAKFFASQNVAKESQFGSVCAHSALPLLRTLVPDAM